MDRRNKYKLITALLAGTVFGFLAFYLGYVERFMPWWCELTASLLVAATVILMFINVVRQVVAIIKNRKELNPDYFYPLAIYIAVILAPIGAWEDHLSAVKFRACYEGTQNQAYIVFRTDNSFELNWTGAFFANKWYMGTWKKKDNILILKYQTNPVDVLGSTLLIKDGYLVPLDKSVELRFKARPMFYLGYCKGEN